MVRQVNYEEEGITARVEVIGAERRFINEEDLDFMVNIIMGMTLCKRNEIDEIRCKIVEIIRCMMAE